MTSGNVSDEPIAYRDDDALRAARRRSPTCFLVHDRPIQTRTDDSVVRVVARPRAPLLLRRSRGYVPGSAGAAGRRGAPAARLRRRAEEHVLRGQGRARLGRPPHRRPARTTRRCARSPRASSTSSACSRSSPRWSRTTCTPSTSRPSTRSSATGVELDRRAAPPRAPGRVPRRARRDRARRSARSSTAPATAPTARSGAASCCVGDLRGLRARRAPVRRCGCPAARRRSASRGGWPARGWRRPAAEPPALPPALAARSTERWRAGRRAGAQRAGVAAHDERRAGCSTRSPRSAACAPRSTTRARRRSSSRRPATRHERGAYPLAAATRRGSLDARRAADRARVVDDVARGAAPARRRRPLPQRGSPRRPRACALLRERTGPRPSCSPAACSRTGACSSARRGAADEAGLRVLVARAAAAERRRDLLRPGRGGGRRRR